METATAELILKAAIWATVILGSIDLARKRRATKPAEIAEPVRSVYDVPAYQRRAPRAPRGPVPQPPRARHLKERIRTQRERVSREQ